VVEGIEEMTEAEMKEEEEGIDLNRNNSRCQFTQIV